MPEYDESISEFSLFDRAAYGQRRTSSDHTTEHQPSQQSPAFTSTVDTSVREHARLADTIVLDSELDNGKAGLADQTQGGFRLRKPTFLQQLRPPIYLSIEVDTPGKFRGIIFPLARRLGYNRFKVAKQTIFAPKVCQFADEGCGSGLFGKNAVDYKYGVRWRTYGSLACLAKGMRINQLPAKTLNKG